MQTTEPVAVPSPAAVTAAPVPGTDGNITLVGTSNVQPGDFLAVGVGPATPNGFLGKVTAVHADNGETVVSTTPAALTDVLPEGDIDQTMTTGEQSSNQTATHVNARAAAAALSPSCGGSGTLTLPNPKITLSKSVTFKAHWSLLHGLENANLTGDATAKASVSAGVSGEVHCSVPSTSIAEFKGTPVTFQIGPVPVVLTPNARVTVDAAADASASFTTGMSVQATATAGVKYVKGDGTSPIASFTPSWSYTAPTVSASAGLSANVTPTINVLVYGVAGPELAFKAGLALNADTHANPWWTLTAPVDLTAQLVVPALKLSTGKLHVFKKTYTLAHADGPFSTGTTEPTLTTARPIDGGTRFEWVPPAPIEDLTPRYVSAQYRDNDNDSWADWGSTADTDPPADFPSLYLTTPGRQWRIAYVYDGGTMSEWSNAITPSAADDIGAPTLTSAVPVDGGTRFRFTAPPGLPDLTPRYVSAQYRDNDNDSWADWGSTADTDPPADFPSLYLTTPGRQWRIAYVYDGGTMSEWSNAITPPAYDGSS